MTKGDKQVVLKHKMTQEHADTLKTKQNNMFAPNFLPPLRMLERSNPPDAVRDKHNKDLFFLKFQKESMRVERTAPES